MADQTVIPMETPGFSPEEVVSYWLTEADEALRVADHLVEKADYSYALFFGHLAVEKVLKALYANRRGDHAPPIHNLLRLAKAVGLDLDEAQTEALVTITAFNIEARYPDLRRTFRRKCTAEFTQVHMATVKELYRWLRSLIQ
jgi:HEPN domain-containing protein